MKPLKLTLLIAAVLAPVSPIFADDLDDLKAEISQMRADYEQRINQLEQRLAATESSTIELNEFSRESAFNVFTTSIFFAHPLLA